MSQALKRIGLTVPALILALGLTAEIHASHSTESFDGSDEVVQSITLSYEQGQLITISASIDLDGEDAAQAREAYFAQVLPIASGLGLRRDINLRIAETVVGQFEPGGYGVFSWPSAEAERGLSEHPDWLAIKALRPVAWDTLRLYSVVLEEDLELRFEAGKAYSVAVAWINPEYPENYDRYLDALEPALNAMGARYMYRMRDPRFESHSEDGPEPGRVTFVEWQSAQDLQAFLDSTAFAEVYPLLQQGVSRFELHRIEPQIPTR
ncbi:MAG: DUF1330 domain-containing protein [Alphaproteobacteria bacterium]|nr:DUF1330 domain-containing protein [Alphaproteobacteria bacterium]